ILEKRGHPDWKLTIDITENRGLDYYSGLSFSIFVPGVSCEVGRGGRYRIEGVTPETDTEATGFTLYVETLRGLLPEPRRGKRIFISEGIASGAAEKLRAEDYIVVHALSEYGSGEEEAKRLGCGWIYENGKVKALA
ncbi:MAG: ATP phosphoribosyltransferase regulatory subunit, partial [Pseudomonadota bacterium]|nr:ATP phosphoribosyltransferase regulatory subunit [Pseudomonadota bacterium]